MAILVKLFKWLFGCKDKAQTVDDGKHVFRLCRRRRRRTCYCDKYCDKYWEPIKRKCHCDSFSFLQKTYEQ